MKIFFAAFLLFAFLPSSKAVTTKMFKVLDTCARYKLMEIDAKEAVEKLKLESKNSSEMDLKKILSTYCSVFTPNKKIEF